MPEVQKRKTVPTIREWRDAISAAWKARTGRRPSLDALSVLFAQWSLETGRGEAMWCHNFGGIKGYGGTSRHWRGDYCMLPTFEYDAKGKRYNIVDRFRSYPTMRAGADDYLAFLGRDSYRSAWARIEAGDPRGFARELKVRNYYTAPESDYAAGLSARAKEGLEAIKKLPPEAAVGGGVVLVGLLVGAGWWLRARRAA